MRHYGGIGQGIKIDGVQTYKFTQCILHFGGTKDFVASQTLGCKQIVRKAIHPKSRTTEYVHYYLKLYKYTHTCKLYTLKGSYQNGSFTTTCMQSFTCISGGAPLRGIFLASERGEVRELRVLMILLAAALITDWPTLPVGVACTDTRRGAI